MTKGNIAADQLRLFIERIERLEAEKKGIADDIHDVYSEAKSQGYDAKIMRQIVKLRKMDNDDRMEMEAVLETYKSALGLASFADTPLGDFAKTLAEMDEKGIGMSLSMGDGPVTTLNQTALRSVA